ncbi:hypothetical protein [Paenibacillus amylolyticus]|uniref:hypothetical protein n=1 Tax=Paenibacillus amylolyticus TaxID=1451 RepID=UPI00249A92E8|nr:hypothetical protein [Paenibacillus amylolyticus]WFA84598.1 hypothetical protein OGI70_27310 [Paenibacillus amylolyticus]
MEARSLILHTALRFAQITAGALGIRGIAQVREYSTCTMFAKTTVQVQYLTNTLIPKTLINVASR